jgi:hypothetical protein
MFVVSRHKFPEGMMRARQGREVVADVALALCALESSILHAWVWSVDRHISRKAEQPCASLK